MMLDWRGRLRLHVVAMLTGCLQTTGVLASEYIKVYKETGVEANRGLLT